MRHRIGYSRLNRTSAHHKAMQRNLAQSLIQHEQVRTTIQKARDLRPFVEKLVTLAKKAKSGSITARRQIHKLLSDRSFIPQEHQEAYDDMPMAKREKVMRFRSGRRHRKGEPRGKLSFTAMSITHRLINDIADRYEDRPGGYTRIIKLGERRIGDGGELAMVQFVGDEEGPGPVTKPAKSSRKRRADARYALAVKLGKDKSAGGKTSAPVEDAAPQDEPQTPEEPTEDAPKE